MRLPSCAAAKFPGCINFRLPDSLQVRRQTKSFKKFYCIRRVVCTPLVQCVVLFVDIAIKLRYTSINKART